MRVSQFTLFGLFFASSSAYTGPNYNLTPGVTPISHSIYNLHMTVFYICVAIGVVVFGTMIYAIIHHRKSKGVKAAHFHEHLWLEITWTIIPFLILIALAIPGTRVLISMQNTDKPDLTIKITGYQWKWKYDYLEQGISFFSNISTPFDQLHGNAPKNPLYILEVDHPLVLPVHQKIRFLVTSNDVIHAWWVPALGVKRDGIPGFINESWARINRPGTYRGQCAELCGLNHAYMPIVVTAVSEKAFNDWIIQQKSGASTAMPVTSTLSTAPVSQTSSQAAPAAAAVPTKKYTLEELIARGKPIFLNTCSACHKPDGTGMPPVFPNLTISPVVNGPVEKHIHTVTFGVPGTAMQAFGQQFSPEDIAAVITYERNDIGQKKGEMVQPADVIAAEKGGKS
jgi:cytochrome c oxidase subunit 2